MSLNWNVNKIADYNTNFPVVKGSDGPEWNPVTMALVWHSMGCGFYQITDKNYREVFARIRATEEAFGSMMQNKDGEVPITFENVQKHIGLTTNAFPAWSQAKFERHLGQFLYKKAFQEIQREEREEQAATA